MNAAETIRAARLAAGLTQVELADRSGVRQPNIAAYENGTRTISFGMLDRLVTAARDRPSVPLRRHRDEVLRIASLNRATNVRVFGSIARGEDRPDSDVDLLVTFEPGASLFDQAGLIEDLEKLLGRHVDLVSEGGLREAPRRNCARGGAAVTPEPKVDGESSGPERTSENSDDVGETFNESDRRSLGDILRFSQHAVDLVSRGKNEYDNDRLLQFAGEAVISRSVRRSADCQITSLRHPGDSASEDEGHAQSGRAQLRDHRRSNRLEDAGGRTTKGCRRDQGVARALTGSWSEEPTMHARRLLFAARVSPTSRPD